MVDEYVTACWDPEDDYGDEEGAELEPNGIHEIDLRPKIFGTGRKRFRGNGSPREPIHWSVKAKVANRDGWRCFYCEVDLTDGSGHFDHKIPVVRGGRSEFRNLAYCCAKCNLRKKDMVAADFLDLLAEERLAKAEGR